MTIKTLSTSDVSERLGFNLTGEFITDTLGVDAADTMRNKPRWSDENYVQICAALADHLGRCVDIRTPAAKVPEPFGGRKPGSTNKTKSITASPKKAPAMDYDNDDL